MLQHLVNILKEKLNSSLGKDIIITLVAQSLIMILAFILNKILSIKLGVEGYGQYSIIKKSAAVLSFVMLSGMGIALPRYLASFMAKKEYKNAKSAILSSLTLVLLISLIVLLICLIFQHSLTNLIAGNENSQLYFSAILYAFSITISSLLFAYYRGLNSFLLFNISQIAIQLVMSIFAIVYGNNLLILLNTWSLATFIIVLIATIKEAFNNQLFSKNPINWKDHFQPQLKDLSIYGLPRLIGDFILFSFAAFPLIYISQKTGIRDSSFFATGLTLISFATPFFAFTGMVLLPYVSSSIATNDFRKVDKLINQLGLLFILFSLVAILLLWFGMDIFIKLFFSTEFLPSANISKILILSVIFESVYLLLRNPIDAISKIPYNTFNLLTCFMVMIVLFLRVNTIEGYAYSFLFVSFLKALLSWIIWQYCKKKLSSSSITDTGIVYNDQENR